MFQSRTLIRWVTGMMWYESLKKRAFGIPRLAIQSSAQESEMMPQLRDRQ
jgi:hypothetical protein